jgi:hypothetical protein
MATITVDVRNLIGRPLVGNADEILEAVLSNEAPTDDTLADVRAVMGKFWGIVLLLAIRDRATSVQYHPWRGAGALSYVVDDIRYEMVPPEPEDAAEIAAAARAMFTRRPGVFARLFGCGPVSCGTVALAVNGPTVWDVICWSSGARSGVEFFRVTPLDPSGPDTSPPASPPG